jgi:hypothetical protein
MLLKNPSPVELQRLRRITSLPESKVTYLVMRLLPSPPAKTYEIFAYAKVKQTATAWRKLLGSRMEHVTPASKAFLLLMRSNVVSSTGNHQIEEHGTMPTRLIQQLSSAQDSQEPQAPKTEASNSKPRPTPSQACTTAMMHEQSTLEWLSKLNPAPPPQQQQEPPYLNSARISLSHSS